MAQAYFNQLNYTLGNEDTAVDVEIIRRLGSKSVFSVAGCGSRSLPLLEVADSVVMGDVSPYQLSLCRLRKGLYESLDFEEFLIFFDFPPFHSQDNSYKRKSIFKKLNLSPEDRSYFQEIFQGISWKSLLYIGKWERTFQTMSKALRLIVGKDYSKIFDFHSLDEQKYYFANDFPMMRWKALIFLLGNKSVFNALLYKGDFIVKNAEESHFDYYKNSFDSLFGNNLARNSFFLHLCFFGELIHSDGNPIEACKGNFLKVKESLGSGARAETHQGDLVSFLADPKQKEEFDFVGLSDVPSYFSGDLERDFIQTIRPSLNKGGVVCLRNYLRSPEANTEGFEDVTSDFEDIIKLEKVGVYRFQLLRKY
jgi:S-adenosylmethionine-diacylglycerol 3-amino-3-carboxypropyl transferase